MNIYIYIYVHRVFIAQCWVCFSCLYYMAALLLFLVRLALLHEAAQTAPCVQPGFQHRGHFRERVHPGIMYISMGTSAVMQ